MQNNIDTIKHIIDTEWDISPSDNIALCDVDGTIFRDSFFLEILDRLIQIKDATDMHGRHERMHILWKAREITYDEYLWEAIDIFLELIVWVSQKDFEDICHDAVVSSMSRTYVWTKSFLNNFIEQGWKVFLVSGSPMEIVQEFAELSGFSGAVGSYYFCDKNWIKTGERCPLFSNQAKLDVLNYVREKFNPKSIVGIGDTNGDFSMITMADYGYTINPSKELATKLVTQSHVHNLDHVMVITERKDLQLRLTIPELNGNILD